MVAPLDLQRYAGIWYEQARLPNWFQRNCTGQVAATYGLQPGGLVSVVNRCARADGSVIDVSGVARTVQVPGQPGAGKLEVRFAPDWLAWVPLVWGDYWVIQLDADYQVSLVGTPDRKYLWLLSRAPKLDEARIQAALAFAQAAGFDAASVVRTPVTPALPALR